MDDEVTITVEGKEYLLDCSRMTAYDGSCRIIKPEEFSGEVILIPHIIYLARPYISFREEGRINNRGFRAIEASLKRKIVSRLEISENE